MSVFSNIRDSRHPYEQKLGYPIATLASAALLGNPSALPRAFDSQWTDASNPSIKLAERAAKMKSAQENAPFFAKKNIASPIERVRGDMINKLNNGVPYSKIKSELTRPQQIPRETAMRAIRDAMQAKGLL